MNDENIIGAIEYTKFILPVIRNIFGINNKVKNTKFKNITSLLK